jgi:hypothetical protein
MTLKSRTRVAVASAVVIVLAASAAHAENLQTRHAGSVQKPAHLHRDGAQGRESEQGPWPGSPSSDCNAILIQTGPNTWKAKCIRRGSPVLVWIGTAEDVDTAARWWCALCIIAAKRRGQGPI